VAEGGDIIGAKFGAGWSGLGNIEHVPCISA
jgi:hypothetical protein